eukprot:Filipodium_phascolosomae@DN897_c0_g1_i1.p1
MISKQAFNKVSVLEPALLRIGGSARGFRCRPIHGPFEEMESFVKAFQDPKVPHILRASPLGSILSEGGRAVDMLRGYGLGSTDIMESPKVYKFIMDLPGFKKKDVKINVKDHILTVSGERPVGTVADGEAMQFNERAHGHVERCFKLPADCNVANPNAGFEDGVLTIEFARCEPENETVIEIK